MTFSVGTGWLPHPRPAQLTLNSRRRPETTGLGGFPGCQKRFVQGAPLPARELIAFVVDNQIDNRTLGQGSRLVEDGPPLLDTCSESAHMATVRDSKVLGKRSRARRAGAGELFFRPPITLVENCLMEFLRSTGIRVMAPDRGLEQLPSGSAIVSRSYFPGDNCVRRRRCRLIFLLR